MSTGRELVERHRDFFVKQKAEFIKAFIKESRASNPSLTPDSELLILVAKVFEHFFPFSPVSEQRDLTPVIAALVKRGVDPVLAFKKASFLLGKEFGAYISSRRADPGHLRSLVSYRDGALRVIEDMVTIIEGMPDGFEQDEPEEEESVTVKLHQKRLAEEKQQKELASIMDALMKTRKADKELKLYNVYKGVSVSYSAKIKLLETRSATLVVHKYQAIAMKLEELVYFRSPLLERAVLADVIRVDMDARTALLKNFRLVDSSPDKRKFVRVQPKEPVEVLIYSDSEIVSGQLFDLSVRGMAVFAQTRSDFTVKQPVNIYLKLPDELNKTALEIKMPANILRVINDQPPYRIVLDLKPQAQAENLVSRYLFQRQIELVRELQSHQS